MYLRYGPDNVIFAKEMDSVPNMVTSVQNILYKYYLSILR